MVGSLRKDGRVQGWYKVPAASANKLYPLNCGACVKLEEIVSLTAGDWERTRVETQRQMHLTTMIPHPQHQLAKCVIPTPVTPGATEAQVYDALFKKGAVCLGADPRLQALQDICAKTLQGYQPQLTGNDITFVAQTAAVRLSTLMEVSTQYVYIDMYWSGNVSDACGGP